MNQHKASNGVTVYLDSNGNLKFQKSHAVDIYGELEAFWVQAAREFFQAERDEELGRWRDPENPDWVVYRADSGDAAYVLNEREGSVSQYWTRRNVESCDPAYTGYSATCYTAQRYFAAHPEPKPWDAAQPDEVWVLTINNDREDVFRCGENGLYSLKTGNPLGSLLSCGSNKITAGRRIWPEEDK